MYVFPSFQQVELKSVLFRVISLVERLAYPSLVVEMKPRKPDERRNQLSTMPTAKSLRVLDERRDQARLVALNGGERHTGVRPTYSRAPATLSTSHSNVEVIDPSFASFSCISAKGTVRANRIRLPSCKYTGIYAHRLDVIRTGCQWLSKPSRSFWGLL